MMIEQILEDLLVTRVVGDPLGNGAFAFWFLGAGGNN